jgi:glutaminyl-peptide cyclotransferase
MHVCHNHTFQLLRFCRVALLLLICMSAVACDVPSRTAGAGSVGVTSPSPTATVVPLSVPLIQNTDPGKLPVLPMPTVAPTPGHTTVAPTPSVAVGPDVVHYTYRVIQSYPHDPGAFTQGLQWQDGNLYEGTGLHGRSSIRRVDLATGAVLQQRGLAPEYFGEGITILGDRLYQLTWQSNIGFVYDKETFELLRDWSYPTEGWGLTHDGAQLIMSDGTRTLRFLDPETLEVRRELDVVDEYGAPVDQINELEYVRGEIFANIWQTDRIARINPNNGRVVGWIDLSGLLPSEDRRQPVDVLNGIAYDAEQDRLFVTGKLWPRLFEIELLPKP